MNNKPIVYLAGNMTPSPAYYNVWSHKMSTYLERRYRCSASNFKSGNNFIVQQDLGRMKNAHMLIANLGVVETQHHLTGLIVECYEAFKQNMPVYAFVSSNMKRSEQADSPWLQSFITKEFQSELELINYLLTEDNLLV